MRQHATRVVSGNHDWALGYDEDPRCSPPYRAMAAEMAHYTASALTPQNREYLRQLPLQTNLGRDGRRFHLCHAIPSDPLYGYCPAESDRWGLEVGLIPAEILLVGHTHTPFVHEIGSRRVVNPGSLGQPKIGAPNACYAVWEDGRFDLRRYAYPVQDTINKLHALPLSAEVRHDLIAVLLTGVPAARSSSDATRVQDGVQQVG